MGVVDMDKLLIVTPTLDGGPPGGRAMLSRLHQNCLRSIYTDKLVVHRLTPHSLTGLRGSVRALGGGIDGVSRVSAAAVLSEIREHGATRVWLDGSNLGRLAQIIKHAVPSVELFTFFHNVEATFFAGSFRRDPSFRAAGVLMANTVAERMAVRFSDRLVVLSGRESAGLRRIYGRGATDVLPMALEDRFSPDVSVDGRAGDHLLFVGGAFYANVDGIKWFARNVARRMEVNLEVVGHGMESLRGSLNAHNRINIVGPVDGLQGHYLAARGVIAPIFAGSGMKTKVAEALMFGKRLIGTAEAFSGYEEVSTKVGWTCETAEEWMAAIDDLKNSPAQRFDPKLRSLYEQHYSYGATITRLGAIFHDIT